MLPGSVRYDPEPMLSLPAQPSATSGKNAIAHAVEGLHALDATPIVLGTGVTRALVAALPRVVDDGSDLEARGEAHGMRGRGPGPATPAYRGAERLPVGGSWSS